MTETLTIGVINLWRPQNTTNFVTPTPPAEKMNNIVLNIELVYGLQRQKIACLILTPYTVQKYFVTWRTEKQNFLYISLS